MGCNIASFLVYFIYLKIKSYALFPSPRHVARVGETGGGGKRSKTTKTIVPMQPKVGMNQTLAYGNYGDDLAQLVLVLVTRRAA